MSKVMTEEAAYQERLIKEAPAMLELIKWVVLDSLYAHTSLGDSIRAIIIRIEGK